MKGKKYPKKMYGKGMNLKDNTQASSVRPINTNTEQYDLGKIKKYSSGSKGYPSQALPNSI